MRKDDRNIQVALNIRRSPGSRRSITHCAADRRAVRPGSSADLHNALSLAFHGRRDHWRNDTDTGNQPGCGSIRRRIVALLTGAFQRDFAVDRRSLTGNGVDKTLSGPLAWSPSQHLPE